jgi:hypothetical protein
MSHLEPPPVDPRGAGPGPHDLDGLLRAYFRAEMPDPWPVLRLPILGQPGRGRTRSSGRSHLALAASVALLMGGTLWLAGTFPTTDSLLPEDSPASLTADTPQPENATASRKAPGLPPHKTSLSTSHRKE